MNNKKGRYVFWSVIALIVLVSIALSRLYVDWLWFKSLKFNAVFATTLGSRIGVWAAAFLFAFVFFLVNLLLTRRQVKPHPRYTHGDDDVIYLDDRENPWQRLVKSRFSRWAMIGIAFFMALLVSGNYGARWLVVQQWLHRVSFGATDPIFGNDIGFYVFSLPFYHMVYSLLISTIIITLIGVSVIYLINATMELFLSEWEEVTFAKRHLGVLLTVALLVGAVGYKLAAFNLLYAPGGVVYGAGYADIHAKLLGYNILFWVAIITAAAILVNLMVKKVRWILYALSGWLVMALIMLVIYPGLVQKLIVDPNEYNLESPYIKNAIKMTRSAYALDRIDSRQFNISYDLTARDVTDNPEIFKNIRLWDWQPLKTTYKQIQEIRPYYVFEDVDMDRYYLNGEYRQVMLAARELTPEGLPTQAKTWVNMRLKYTHGYGLAVSTVNEVAQEGLPRLIIKDFPPRFSTDLTVKQPQIYFGEVNNDYVIVNSATREFDYPTGADNVYTTYKADAGLKVGGIFNRLVYAYVLGDYKLLISTQVRHDSRILMNRNINVMLEKIAPFLVYDDDPYMVIADGKLYWMVDAYTVTGMYPYSEPYEGSGLNYIRNAVKVVIDAYSGQPVFYVADSNDPIIRSYRGIFPSLFTDMESMPASLKSHIRYPENMFSVQTRMLTTYHMTNPQTFYYKEDKWNLPQEVFGSKQVEMEPYYMITRFPGADKAEYILMLPFTPSTKQNMIAWLAARSDGENYGKLVLYLFPKQELIFGPMQVESRINQDSSISQQLTLWDQKGSSIFRGNLLVIPVKNSLLYVEPLYLQASQSKMPELKRIIAVYGDNVVMEPTLEGCLVRLFGEGAGTAVEPSPTQPGAGVTLTVADLARQASELYSKAEQSLRSGDFAGYGEYTNRLKGVLEQLNQLVNEGVQQT